MAKRRRAPPPQPTSSSSSSSSSSSEEEEVEEHSHKEQPNNTKPDPQKQGPESERRGGEKEAGENPHPAMSTPSKPKPNPESEKMANKPNGKSPIKRSWTFEDEISILEAMVEYQKKNGTIRLTAEGVGNFHDSVQNSLSKNVTNVKFADKLRKMRKKFASANKNVDKINKFAQPHDKTVYELSKKIWGKERKEKEVEKDGNSGGKERKGSKRDFPYFRDAMGRNMLAMEMLEMVDEQEAMVFEDKFKKLKFAEFDLVRKAHKFLLEEAKHLLN